jgi:hypothetical protein
MMKFFRKHNKKLLAIFMSLLMLVFLGGSALDNLLRPSGDRVVAHSAVGDIGYLDQRAAEGTTTILSTLNLNWQRPFGMTEPLEHIDWVILTREAKRLGMASSPATVRSTFSGDFDVNELSRALKVKPEHIWQALAEYTSVQQTALAVGGATAPSEAEVLTSAKKALAKVKIQTALIHATAFVDETAEFSGAQINAQFSAHREKEPGGGLAFGYYVPPAIKVQYIRIDRNAIADRVRVSADTLDKRAKTFFEERLEHDPAFKRPAEKALTAAGPTGEGAFEGPPQDQYLTWAEAKEFALGVVRKQQADEAAARIATWLIEYAGEPWVGQESGKEGYKKVPAHAATPEYYEGIEVPVAIAYPEAVTVGVTAFFSADKADEVPLLGKAQFRADAGTRQSLNTLAFRTQSIVPTIPNDRTVNPSDFLATFQTCRYPLTDADGHVYVFRVIDGRLGHIAESVDEVRDRVIADLRLQGAYERALARAESLRSCASSTGLGEAYESDAELAALKNTPRGAGSGYFEPPPFSRATRGQVARGRETQTVSIGGGVGSVPAEVVAQCFALAAAEDKTAVIELRDRPCAMVVVLVEAEPGYVDEFQGMRVSLVEQMSRLRAQDAIADWLNPEQIRARNAFKLATE